MLSVISEFLEYYHDLFFALWVIIFTIDNIVIRWKMRKLTKKLFWLSERVHKLEPTVYYTAPLGKKVEND